MSHRAATVYLDHPARETSGKAATHRNAAGRQDRRRTRCHAAEKLAFAIRKANLTPGVIDRIVRGRLIYVAPSSGRGAFAFKMAQVILDTPTGPRPYRGENFDILGVRPDYPVRWGVLGAAAAGQEGLFATDLRLVIPDRGLISVLPGELRPDAQPRSNTSASPGNATQPRSRSTCTTASRD